MICPVCLFLLLQVPVVADDGCEASKLGVRGDGRACGCLCGVRRVYEAYSSDYGVGSWPREIKEV